MSGPTGSEVEYEVECYAKCAFAEFRPKVKYWVRANATLLEANLTVVSDSSFAGMAWTPQIPIERFAGKTIYAIKADGSLVPLKLREQHVPGQAGLFSTDSAVGWLTPPPTRPAWWSPSYRTCGPKGSWSAWTTKGSGAAALTR